MARPRKTKGLSPRSLRRRKADARKAKETAGLVELPVPLTKNLLETPEPFPQAVDSGFVSWDGASIRTILTEIAWDLPRAGHLEECEVELFRRAVWALRDLKTIGLEVHASRIPPELLDDLEAAGTWLAAELAKPCLDEPLIASPEGYKCLFNFQLEAGSDIKQSHRCRKKKG